MRLLRFGRRGMATLVALSTIALSATPVTVLGADEGTGHDHSHATASAAPKADCSGVSDMMEQMRAMHAKMAAAKTPAEWAALMQSQMTLMRSGVNMMQGMRCASHDHMNSRMDMMQMMMQMMVDRMSGPAPDSEKPAATK